MDRWLNKVAIVTGASSGIGAAIAEKLVDLDFRVVGIARRKSKLNDYALTLEGRGKFYTLAADVTKEEEVLEAFKWVRDNLGPVHVLVNNAGVARATTLIDGDVKLWREVLAANVMSLCICTREAVKDMRANKVDGHIIHTNSIAGHKVWYVPGMNMYPASKHAVTALAETLRLELNAIGSKIKITSISPGLVRTSILKTSTEGCPDPHPYQDEAMKEPQLLPEDVAEAVVFALSTPPNVQISELTIKPIGEKF